MNRINYRISLDMFEVAAQTTIKAKKGDTACSIHITLTENGKIYNITDGCYAVFSAKKPDGNYIFNSDTCSIEDNAIVYDFTEQTVPCEGVVECEVILFKDEQRLTSPRFNLVVDSTVYNGEEIVSSVSIDVFDQMIEEVKDRATDEIVNESVSHSQEQKLTDEQKEVARNNIDAVDANLVVSSFSDPSSHPRDVKIPNGAALFEYVADYSNTFCVRNDVQQEIPAYNQELARSNIGAVSQAELGSAVIDKVSANELIGAIAATKATVVSAFEQQNFTDEQKATARANVDAISPDEVASALDEKVDASLVVSNIISDTGTLLSNNIPNGSAVADFIRNNSVSSAQVQSLTLSKKARARSNINAAEDAGTWELLYTIEGDGTTNTWEFTKFADGSDLKLRAAAVKTINTVAASADTYGFIYAYDSSFNTISTAIITKFLSKTAGAVALGIIEQDKGYYRAYAADGASKNPGNVRYSGFQQYNKIGNIETTPYIPRIKVNNQTTAYLPVGSTIEVWGVKA